MHNASGYRGLLRVLLAVGCAKGQPERKTPPSSEGKRPTFPYDTGSSPTPERAPDANRIASFAASIAPFLREYPPSFQDAEHERRLRRTTMEMVDELNALDLSDVKDSDVLTSIAFIFSMAHNLDLGTAPKAKEVFERSLSMNPDNLRSNYLFGMFLVSTREHHFDALPFLEKALALGEKDARYTIGLLLVEKGERDKGIQILEAYAADHPEQTRPRSLIQAIKEGTLKFRSN